MFEDRFEESKNEDPKEMFENCRVDVEVLSSEEISPLVGTKYFLELRQAEYF